MTQTIFSKIISREIPAQLVFESESVLAFKDIDPKAPTHILIIPKKELRDLSAATQADASLLGELLLAAASIAKSEGISEAGYRVVINTGANGGQTVFHLHMHLLGGREMQWPPG